MAGLGVVHGGVTAAVLALALPLSGVACSNGDDDPGGAGGDRVPAGWEVERDRDFTIAVPADWRYRRETSASGNEFVNFVSPKEADGYPQSVVIGRTADVAEGDFTRLIDVFRNVQGDRTFGDQREVEVEGARKALLVESTRPQGEQRVPVRAWNLFVLSPSSVGLNVEFVAPVTIFDEALFERILETLVLRERRAGAS